MDSDRVNSSSDLAGQGTSEVLELKWIEAASNSLGVRLLDVRPITQNMLSSSANPLCASNAMSFGQDDGTSFVGQEPSSRRITEASLCFPVDRTLADGVLYVPSEMEHKWALFFHRGEITCVRSWLRQVKLVAHVEQHRDHVEITSVRGTFQDEDEAPEFTIRALDYLLRSHALDAVYPVPLPTGMDSDPKDAAMWCMSMFGKLASIATPDRFPRTDPKRPLRTHSLLHIAVARGDAPAIDRCLNEGVPIDLRARDGLTPLHWALASDDPAIMALLLDRGSPVDVLSDQGATPLMNAVQSSGIEMVRFLIDRGANLNARDRRGFTALHRAAETGRLDVVQLLLDRGADPNPEAEGHTPRSLAEGRNQGAIVAILDKWIGDKN